jgi:hypothetical protein
MVGRLETVVADPEGKASLSLQDGGAVLGLPSARLTSGGWVTVTTDRLAAHCEKSLPMRPVDPRMPGAIIKEG